MLDQQRQELKIAYAEGYPLDLVLNFRLKVGQGIVGAAVAEQRRFSSTTCIRIRDISGWCPA